MTAKEMIRAGYEARRQNRAEDALKLFAQAFEGVSTADERIDALCGWANSESDLGHLDVATAKYKESVGLLRGLDQPLKLAHVVRHLGDVQRKVGLLTTAGLSYEEALEIYRKHPAAQPLDVGNALRGYGLLLEAMGDSPQAREVWLRVLGIYREVGVQ